MKRFEKIPAVFALLALITVVWPSAAADQPQPTAPTEPTTVHGVTFSATAQAGSQQFALRGAGLLRYRRLIPVYAAALYVAPGAERADPLGDYAKRLEVEYLVKAAARQFNEAGDAVLQATLPAEKLADLRPRLDRIASLFPDPKPGDRCALTYLPGVGTELTYNGNVLGTIPGEDFQRAYFQIWLGAEPASVPLRNALLRVSRRGAG